MFLTCFLWACKPAISEKNLVKKVEWKDQFNNQLSEFGHRNWILIVDKAYPSQNSPGVITIDTQDDLLNVLDYSLKQIHSSTHVKPIVYTDKELNYITPQQVADIVNYRDKLSKKISLHQPKVILHDSVFVKIDEASKLFKILVLKTNAVIPYSSVFLQLDCKYWTSEKENNLRMAIKQVDKK
jgi:Ni,Fe-hydrogenase maturation factor